MRKAERAVTDPAEIDRIINDAKVCHLGLTDGMEPYVVPVNFGYDGESVFIHCAPEGRKLDIIAANNLACVTFVADDEIVEGARACNWSTRYRSAIAWGTATIISGDDEKRKALEAIMAQYSSAEHTFSDRDVNKVTIVRIGIDRVTGKQSG